MAKPKLEVYQISSKKNTYLIYRYKDDKNKNFEYQIYKLVKSIPVAKEFGIKDNKPGRKTKLNAREMCNELIKKHKIE